MNRDQLAPRTPMRCPICDRGLERVLVRDIGGVTGDLDWQVHAGECPEHGWFQAEVISKPPREIFPVEKPFGYSGVFADPDGHTWEVAFIQALVLHDDGTVAMPS